MVKATLTPSPYTTESSSTTTRILPHRAARRTIRRIVVPTAIATTSTITATPTSLSSSSTPRSVPRLSPFSRLVYAYTRLIPRGSVSTYAHIAAAIGHPRAYRAVGHALSINPYAPQVPCHRVVASGGGIGGFQGKKGMGCTEINSKIAVLRAEGVEVVLGRVRDAERVVVAVTGTVTLEDMEDDALAAPLNN